MDCDAVLRVSTLVLNTHSRDPFDEEILCETVAVTDVSTVQPTGYCHDMCTHTPNIHVPPVPAGGTHKADLALVPYTLPRKG